MIDHVSIGVADLARAVGFYEQLLKTIGLVKLVEKPKSVGFGKQYPEFWLNHRPDKPVDTDDNGCHICLRAMGIDTVKQFYTTALESGATANGEPGYRPEYSAVYYAAFIKDADNNHIEVVTFVER